MTWVLRGPDGLEIPLRPPTPGGVTLLPKGWTMAQETLTVADIHRLHIGPDGDGWFAIPADSTVAAILATGHWAIIPLTLTPSPEGGWDITFEAPQAGFKEASCEALPDL